MLQWVFNNFQWILGLGGVFGALALGAMFYFAKPWFDVIVSFVSPILTSAGKVGGEAIDMLWNMSGKQVITIFAMCWVAFLSGKYTGENTGKENLMKELRYDYTFVKKKGR